MVKGAASECKIEPLKASSKARPGPKSQSQRTPAHRRSMAARIRACDYGALRGWGWAGLGGLGARWRQRHMVQDANRKIQPLNPFESPQTHQVDQKKGTPDPTTPARKHAKASTPRSFISADGVQMGRDGRTPPHKSKGGQQEGCKSHFCTPQAKTNKNKQNKTKTHIDRSPKSSFSGSKLACCAPFRAADVRLFEPLIWRKTESLVGNGRALNPKPTSEGELVFGL